MKRLIVASFIAFISFACSKDEVVPQPTVTYTATVQPEGIVTFNISTANAETFSWDFGDGQLSTERLPTHTYQKNGVYSVTLTANGKGGQVVKTMSVSVFNITGSVTVWMQAMRNKEIEVYIGGAYAGKITGYYSTGTVPDCGAQFNATLSNLKEGVYAYTAQEVNAFAPTKWSGNITVTARKCSSLKLTY